MEYSKTLGMPICTNNCMYAVEMNSVLRHLRNTHKMDAKEAQVILHTLAIQEKKSEKSAPGLKTLYLEAVNGQNAVTQKLPAIPELPVRNCIKCTSCSYMALNKNTFRRHYGEKCSRENGEAAINCKGQALFGGNKTRYIEVYVESDGACPIMRRVLELEGSKPSRTQEPEISRMDPYLSQMRFDLHLERMQVSLAEAWELCAFENGEDHINLRRVLRDYMRRAYDICQKNVQIQAHVFMDASLQLSLQEETLKRYICRVSRLLSFFLKSFETKLVHVRNAVPTEVQQLVEEIAKGGGAGYMAAMHKVLWHSLFDLIKNGQEGIPVFISCSSVMSSTSAVERKSRFRFGEASETSGMLAALKYVARCVVVTEVYIETKATDRVSKAWVAVEEACNSHADTGISFIAYCMKKSNLIRSGETSDVRFFVCPNHTGCGIVDGFELSLQGLGERMKKLQDKCKDVLEESILQGFSLTEGFWMQCSQLQDNLTERGPGYWFGMHPENYGFVCRWRNLFVAHMRNLLFKDGGLKNKEAVMFLDACEDLQKNLVGLLQVCSGSPARATEVCVVQVCNTDLAGRHLFISGGRLIFTSSYHKGRSMSDGVGKPIARYPDAVTSGILLVYLIVVRPLEIVVVEAVCGNGNPRRVTEHRDFLFASRGRYVEAKTLRDWFQSAMNLVGIPFGVSQYRHFQSGAVKHLLKGERTDDLESSTLAVLHRQAGHSVETAHRIYAVGELDMRKLTSFEMDAFRQSSRSWLYALGMDSGIPRWLEGPRDITPEPLQVEDEQCECKCSKVLSARLAAIEGLLKNIATALPKGDQVAKRTLDLKEDGVPRKKIKVSAKEALRQVLGDTTAEFNNVEQERAVTLAVEGQSDALVILPTGCGKSMAFILAAFVNPTKVCVVVAPLIALQKDLQARCKELGIQVSLWEDRTTAGARIVLASAEHVVTAQYEKYVREQYTLGKLHCLFVDEAHLFLTWQKFRVALKDVGGKMRPKGVDCGLFALTATAPFELSEEIAKACGLNDAHEVIRAKTSRGNIAYRVRDTLGVSVAFTILEEVRAFAQNSIDEKDRVIVYCQTKETCNQLCHIISGCCTDIPCFIYHADLENELRQRNQKDWESYAGGAPKVMIATSAFGCGIDMGTVRKVLHAGRPRRLIEFIQESGRAGRDGDPAEAQVVFSSVEKGYVEEEDERLGSTTFMLGKDVCRRWSLDRYADGNAVKLSCQERSMEVCDVCNMSSSANRESCEKMDVMPSGPGKEPLDGRKESGSDTPKTKKSGFAIAKCGGSSSTYASVSELQDLGWRCKTLCTVCSIREKREVHHDKPSCYRGRCLRCAIAGHDYKDCTNLVISKGVCYGCCLRTYRSEFVHKAGQYGSKCPLQKVMSLCFLAWADPSLNSEMRNDVPEVRKMGDAEFASWLCDTQHGYEAGVGIAGLWVSEKVLSSKARG